jgi:serine/threonine-protein kinase HipA
MDSTIELFAAGQWHRAATVSVTPHAVRFEYLPEYVFGEGAWPVALSLPVGMETHTAGLGGAMTPLAFLWDLVPQGRGRQYLAGLLGLSDQDPAQDLPLAQHGAFAPIGRLRLDTAAQFYGAHTSGAPAAGFTTKDMTARTDAFLEQLALHNMLAAGTPGVQGVAPKFLLTQDAEERWYPDVALPDAKARQHWIVKLPRGREAVDLRILRHEAIYLQAATACGLRAIDAPIYREGMLFLRRFDRQVAEGGVVRLHQETLAALAGLPGFGRSASLFTLTERLAAVATNPAEAVGEFLCRDALNRALRNPDNHLRNTSVQQLPDGTVQLTPLYDLGPMYLDRELIARTCTWLGPQRQMIDDWNDVLELLELDEEVKAAVAGKLREFGDMHLPKLADQLQALDADAGIIEACRPAIEQQIHKLQEVRCHATPAP